MEEESAQRTRGRAGEHKYLCPDRTEAKWPLAATTLCARQLFAGLFSAAVAGAVEGGRFSTLGHGFISP